MTICVTFNRDLNKYHHPNYDCCSSRINSVRMLTRQFIRGIYLSQKMSGSVLERIIANNKIAEQSLDALKREVIKQCHRKYED